MTHETILRLPDPLLREACALARSRDQSVGEIVRNALASELRRARRKARKKVKTLEVEVAPVRAELAGDIAAATSWLDLQARFRNKGYVLRPLGSGLSLFRLVGDARICSASALGPGYGDLKQRFGAPFPGRFDNAHPEIESTEQSGLPLSPVEEEVLDF